MIEAIEIYKSFGDLKVLKGITITVDRGEVVCIVGPSGAGKTTLLQIMGTLMPPDSGNIKFNSSQPLKYKEKELALFRNRNIGFVFQFHHLLSEFTALENVCLPAMIAGKTLREAEPDAVELLNFLNLSNRLYHKPHQMSGGEQQRVAIARALINKPKLILADEPSGNLDSKNKEELHKLFFSLRDKFGQTIIIVTHDKELSAMSDRIITLKDGIVLN